MHNKPGHLGARFFARTLLRLGFLIALTALLAGTGFVGTAASETGVYDVRAYGARGDGVSNDSAAIQAAINAASAVGGTVTVPAGTFAVNSTISLKSGVTVRGAGIDRTILSMPNQSAPTNLLRGSGVNNVSIMDLSLSSPAASGFVFAIGLTNDYSNVTVERVKVTGCQYALKADTQGKNLTVRDFTARASGQIYISNLTGGLFERLDLEMVTQKLTAVTFHAIYMGANNHNLTFRTINLTGGSGFTLQLYTDSGWTLPSDNISFDGLTVEGRWAVVIGSGFQGVTFRNVTAHASLADSPVFSLYDPRDVTVDGFAAAGGNALISARVASPQVIRFQNGTYDGASLPSFPWLTTTNVRLGAASATTTTAPLNATASLNKVGLAVPGAPFTDIDKTDQELWDAAVYVKRLGYFEGYASGALGAWEAMSHRHVALVLERAGVGSRPQWLDDYSLATRGEVMQAFPGLTWYSGRTDEEILRSQMVRLLYRAR